MDSHSFRIIAEELVVLAEGARVEKIHGPFPGTLVFSLFARGGKWRLIFRHERKNPLLFFSDTRLANPARPPAAVMRLRKYCSGRRLGRGLIDYTTRSIAFPISIPDGEGEIFLLLDLVNGASVARELPSGFGLPPAWPDKEIVSALCAASWQKKESDGPWKEHAVLTPLLRETLAGMDPLDGQALLVDLEAGGGELFFYGKEDGLPLLYTAWPLSKDMRSRRGIVECPMRTCGAPFHVSGAVERLLSEFPALAGASYVDAPKFFADYAKAARKEEGLPVRRAAKKQARLLAKLEQEKARLNAMLGLREDAKALQGILWRFSADAKQAEIEVVLENGGVRRVMLDMRLTVRENMARMFHQSARGARGLALLQQRYSEVLASHSIPPPGSGEKNTVEETDSRNENSEEERMLSPRFLQPLESSYKDVARFVSSDGYTLLRGKNARGNHSLLKIGKGHDLWFHAEDGPSAHLIIRRSHAAEEVPERTLLEAAFLVGEKSWQRNDAKARVMVALLRHVHAVKGASAGTVKVDAVLQNLTVSLEESALC